MTDPLVVAERVAETLTGADAVVLVGSVAAGTHHEHSDIDLIAIGAGDECRLQIRTRGSSRFRGERPTKSARRSTTPPPRSSQFPPGEGAWRSSIQGVAVALQREAELWTWEQCPDRSRWSAVELTAYAEECARLRHAILRDDTTLASAMASVLALRLAKIVAVHQGLLLESENQLWDAVSECEGSLWASSQTMALGVEVSDWHERANAALGLFVLAADAVRPALDADQRSVVDHVLGRGIEG